MNVQLPTYEVEELSMEEVIRQMAPDEQGSANDSQLLENVNFEELALLLQA